MMSVDKIDVAAFNALTPAQQQLVLEGLTRKERKVLSQALAEELKSKNNSQVNPTEIEKGDTTKLTPEQQEAKNKANQDILDEIARIKNISAEERVFVDEAIDKSGNDRAFYRNAKARREFKKDFEVRLRESAGGKELLGVLLEEAQAELNEKLQEAIKAGKTPEERNQILAPYQAKIKEIQKDYDDLLKNATK
ncbi:hypothetical protein IJZ97_00585, partial [bacterium]|nr:hypothetical protein [bacterium]